jgi:uncharacterized membrane protein
MEPQRLSALLIITGFLIMLMGYVFGLGNRIYGTTDMDERERIVEENKIRWNATQFLVGVGLLLIPLGYAVLA